MIKKILHILLIAIFLTANTLYGQEVLENTSTISLDFKGMDIVDVLKLLAQRGNLNIAVSKNVRGKVTLFLKDVGVYDAFEIILMSNDLAYEEKGNIITVMTGKDYEKLYGQKFNDKRILKAFPLEYIEAASISKSITQIKSKIGKVLMDEGANTLILIDSPLVIKQAEEIIEKLDKPVETRIFSLNYARGDEIKSKLEEKLTKNIGIVQVDERTNKMIITDLTSKMPQIERLINELDERTKEVLIEAKILEITLNDEFKYGVNWDKVFKISGRLASIAAGANLMDVFAGTILPAETGDIIGGAFQLGTLTANKYEILLQILETIGSTEVLSSPRIVVINNEEASILVGTNQPYATTGTTVSETVSQTTQQVTYLDLGVKLHVTPTINNEGYITMKIKPEVSTMTDSYTITSEEGDTIRTTTVPIISTSQAETTVMVKDGNTIVLAGLIEKRDVKKEDKIPFLADIPFIGKIFSNIQIGTQDQPERKELVIFLTPHIISGDIEAPEVREYITTTEPGKAEIVHPLPKKRVRTRFKTEEIKKLLRGGYDIELAHTQSLIKQRAEIRTGPLASDLSQMSSKAYYNLVRGRVLRKASANYPRSGAAGNVYISFNISSDGRLAGEPKVLTPADETLKLLAVKSVRDAAPFPEFPRTINSKAETFKILISYK